jgi:dTDP-3-amino-3,4,6-trideoxy-alpha-D-glucose transaminase
MIAMNHFQRQWTELRGSALAAWEETGSSGDYILGNHVRAFEECLARFWGLPHAAGVASGTDAVEISLKALGCSPGDRVLTTPVSAFATSLAILKLGAVPVFVDTGDQGLIDLDRCADLLRRRPDIRFFVPVHLYGHVLPLARLRQIREEFDVKVVEDCAQCIGSSSFGEAPGSAGQLAAVSFYPTKNLGAMGDGGAILSRDPQLDARVRVLRDYGQTGKYRHEFIGFNSRLDELQAAYLRRACLPRLEQWNARRRAIARLYRDGIRNAAVRTFAAPEGSASNWHLFPVFVAPQSRERFLEHLQAQGISAGVHYPVAIPDQPALARGRFEIAGDCVNARLLCQSEVSLPVHPYLTDEEVGQVIDAVNRWRPAR